MGGVGRRSRPRPHYPLAVTESRLRLYLRPWFGEKPSKRIGPADNRRWQAHLEELDLANRRARVHSKGGAVEWVFWQTGSAQLLPRLLAGRTAGPVFLADRRPTRTVAGLDLDPASGRARLSYRRAAELFRVRTGWMLHQLRHSALTHAAEDGTNLPLLLARSRHASVRSLERYARPGPEAVARHLAEIDPARRRP